MQRKIVLSMKKYLFISLLALVAIMFTGCTSQNEPCRYEKMTVDIPVKANDWQFDNGTRQYFVTVPVKQLTEDAYRFGNISMYHEYDKGKSSAWMSVLPETTYEETTVDDNPYYYQRHIEYTCKPGLVEIVITISDYYYEDYTPTAMDFKLQIVY